MDIEFDKLIHLQCVDSQINHISLLLEQIPSQIEEIDRKIKSSTQIVLEAKENLAANQKKRRDLEVQVKDLRAQITKYKRQQSAIKTNKEYAALLKEIDETQQKIDALEEEIINEMIQADDIEKEIKEAIQKYREEEQKLQKEKAAIAQNKKELEENRECLLQEKNELVPRIPQYQINLYLKISTKKGGVALSPVTDDFCSMCHMRIRPQVVDELFGTNTLILCENCGRILYWEKKDEESEKLEKTAKP